MLDLGHAFFESSYGYLQPQVACTYTDSAQETRPVHTPVPNLLRTTQRAFSQSR